jgi:hypothetical protein
MRVFRGAGREEELQLNRAVNPVLISTKISQSEKCCPDRALMQEFCSIR